mgnify:CR=1 FL=1
MSKPDRNESDPARLFAALGDSTRLALLARLGGGARSITSLSAGSPFTRQGVTKHLRVLERAGLVRALKQGRERRFEVAPDRIDEARSYLDRVSQQWDDALGRLKALVETD